MAPSALARSRMRERAAVGCEQRAQRERRRPSGLSRRTRPRRRAAGRARGFGSRLSLQPRDEHSSAGLRSGGAWGGRASETETETGRVQRAQGRDERASKRARAGKRGRTRERGGTASPPRDAIKIDAGWLLSAVRALEVENRTCIVQIALYSIVAYSYCTGATY